MRQDRVAPARLRRPVAVVVVVLALGMLLVWWTESSRIVAQGVHAAALAERNGQQALIAQVASSDYRRQVAVLSAMQERGLIGEEERADWIRVLNEVAAERAIADLHHELSSPQPIATDGNAPMQFQYSRMRLQMRLLHEGDLLHLIDRLRQRARAIVHVRACELAWAGDGTTANLDADCQLDWISIRRIGDSR